MGTLCTDRLATRHLSTCLNQVSYFFNLLRHSLKATKSRCPKHISTNTNTIILRVTRTKPCSLAIVANNVAKRRQLKIQTITILEVMKEKFLPNCRMPKKIIRPNMDQSRLKPDDCHNQLIPDYNVQSGMKK